MQCPSIICGTSSEFVSSSIPSWQILTAHAQPFRGARDLAFCLQTGKTQIRLGGAQPHCWFCHEAAHIEIKVFPSCITNFRFSIYLMWELLWRSQEDYSWQYMYSSHILFKTTLEHTCRWKVSIKTKFHCDWSKFRLIPMKLTGEGHHPTSPWHTHPPTHPHTHTTVWQSVTTKCTKLSLVVRLSSYIYTGKQFP